MWKAARPDCFSRSSAKTVLTSLSFAHLTNFSYISITMKDNTILSSQKRSKGIKAVVIISLSISCTKISKNSAQTYSTLFPLLFHSFSQLFPLLFQSFSSFLHGMDGSKGQDGWRTDNCYIAQHYFLYP